MSIPLRASLVLLCLIFIGHESWAGEKLVYAISYKGADYTVVKTEIFTIDPETAAKQVIFALLGEDNLDFLESLNHSSIQLIVTGQEQAADFMEGAYGRLTDRARSCLSTLGLGNDLECRMISTINFSCLFTGHKMWRFY